MGLTLSLILPLIYFRKCFFDCGSDTWPYFAPYRSTVSVWSVGICQTTEEEEEGEGVGRLTDDNDA